MALEEFVAVQGVGYDRLTKTKATLLDDDVSLPPLPFYNHSHRPYDDPDGRLRDGPRQRGCLTLGRRPL